MNGLYRPEAIEADRFKNYSSFLSLGSPSKHSSKFIISASLIFIGVVLLFPVTSVTRGTGYFYPKNGIVPIFSRISGRIVQLSPIKGEVEKGAPLLVVASSKSRHHGDQAYSQLYEVKKRQSEVRKRIVENEIEMLAAARQHLETEQKAELEKLHFYLSEAKRYSDVIREYEEFVNIVKRSPATSKSDLLSYTLQWQALNANLIDVIRSRFAIQAHIADVGHELDLIDKKLALKRNEHENIDLELVSLVMEQDMDASETVIAPESGKLSIGSLRVGSKIAALKPFLYVIPSDEQKLIVAYFRSGSFSGQVGDHLDVSFSSHKGQMSKLKAIIEEISLVTHVEDDFGRALQGPDGYLRVIASLDATENYDRYHQIRVGTPVVAKLVVDRRPLISHIMGK